MGKKVGMDIVQSILLIHISLMSMLRCVLDHPSLKYMCPIRPKQNYLKKIHSN
jgi:hypothetical protein